MIRCKSCRIQYLQLNFQSKEEQRRARNRARRRKPAQAKYDAGDVLQAGREWDSPIAMKADSIRKHGARTEARFFQQFGQTYLHGFSPRPARRRALPGGHVDSAQVSAETSTGAYGIVCNAAARTLSCYIDYYQVKTSVAGDFKWDTRPFTSRRPLQSIQGRIDEVRLTRRPGTAQMLRARRDPSHGKLHGIETILRAKVDTST